LVSRRGAIEARAWITRRVPQGVVFVPFHFAESAANALTIAAFDPRSGIPELKVCAVRLEPIAEQVSALLSRRVQEE
jgi:predicted molibdopterin-dependent oxidoreductase YjgC